MAVRNPIRPAMGVEVLDLRHFSSADLRSLLDQEVQRWGEKLAWDYRSSSEMILRYIDAKILPGYAALERGSIVGYSFFVYEGSKGVIGDLFVSPSRGDARAVQTSLIEHVVETLQQSPGVQRVEAQLLAQNTGELAEPFTANGFHRYRRLFLCLDLATHPTPKPQSVDGVQIRRWTDADYQPSAGIITASYRAHIDSEINDQYRTAGGSMRFLNNIVRFPGCGVFDPEASFVALHPPSNSLIGLILCSRVRDDVGHVTQVCLLPEYRGQGIGENLLAQTCEALRSRKFKLLTLTVTEANRRAVELYRKLGFETRRVFDAFVWEG
ncbi:MAG TPA: GNAT family N-acetyltransferase [Candidatus Binatia bacterium]|jgi:ribosomal protein S18 acetylase RimI-like enzyme|nr:GNAT family N-acetyltransferase [Candidatus Binatia bacterium]